MICEICGDDWLHNISGVCDFCKILIGEEE